MRIDDNGQSSTGCTDETTPKQPHTTRAAAKANPPSAVYQLGRTVPASCCTNDPSQCRSNVLGSNTKTRAAQLKLQSSALDQHLASSAYILLTSNPSQALCCSSTRLLAFQTQLLHLKPLPKPSCQTLSPLRTPLNDSIYESTYQILLLLTLPYLQKQEWKHSSQSRVNELQAAWTLCR